MSPASPSRATLDDGFFEASLGTVDPELAAAIDAEADRERDGIELIASENIVSRAVLEAQGSVLTNKYAEGYPGRRYYGGCEYVDVAELLAIERARRLFGCGFANVQPHSGAQANQAAFLALVKPGDTIMGMTLAAGGHLTHGAPPNLSGKWFHAIGYGVRREDGRIDLDEVARLAEQHRPRLIIAGGSAYARIIDFAGFRAIADRVGACLMVDMAHFAGLVAGGVHPSPIPHAHVVTTTTHKTLRGPRGGMILATDEAIGRRINAAVFPGLQGGPLMHVIAAKAVALKEALQPSFSAYARAVVDNAQALAATLAAGGLAIVSGGTDTHLLLVDLRPLRLTGRDAEQSLERAGIPFDPEKPSVTSGIRLGSPAATTRGFGPAEFRRVGGWIVEVLRGLARNPADNAAVEERVRAEVRELCGRFPVYAALPPSARPTTTALGQPAACATGQGAGA
jgi:glycine hydroxymethyltransferase